VIKKWFATGLIILLPLAVTVAIVIFVLNFVTSPFVGFIEHFFANSQFYQLHQGIVRFLLQISLLIALLFITILLGFLARAVFFRSLLTIYDYVLHRIPLVKTVYKTSQQVIKTVLGGGSRSFKQVVMVPFPHATSYCLGLVSDQSPVVCTQATGSELVTVFLPTAPNPTSGFLIMYPQKDLVYIDMKVDDAIKYVISCGVLTQDEAHQ